MTDASAEYISGYVIKKFTKTDDPDLRGRHPEFARMSRRPGLGFTAMQQLGDKLKSGHGAKYVEREGDVPHVLGYGRKQKPIGRYLVKSLRAEVGLDAEQVKASTLRRWTTEKAEELREKLAADREAGRPSRSIYQIEVEDSAQAALNQEVRYKIFSGGKRKL